MRKLAFSMVVGLSVLTFYAFSFAQQAEAPAYQDGDWWKVKVEVQRQGVYRYGACHEQYSEYLVRFDRGQAVVYGISGNTETKLECSEITSQLLNIPPESGYLKFPLAMGNSWSTRRFFTPAGGKGRWFNYQTKVHSVENLQTQKGELRTFKIERAEQFLTATYFYSPQAKAIVLFDLKVSGETRSATRKVTLIDFDIHQ